MFGSGLKEISVRTHFSPPFALSSADGESVISLSDGVAQCSDRAESVTVSVYVGYV